MGKKPQSQVCPQCSIRFNEPDLLSDHCKTHGHGFTCPWCNNAGPFASMKILNKVSKQCREQLECIMTDKPLFKHCTKVHLKAVSFACPICWQAFMTKIELAAHIRQHANAPAAASAPMTKAALDAHNVYHTNLSVPLTAVSILIGAM